MELSSYSHFSNSTKTSLDLPDININGKTELSHYIDTWKIAQPTVSLHHLNRGLTNLPSKLTYTRKDCEYKGENEDRKARIKVFIKRIMELDSKLNELKDSLEDRQEFMQHQEEAQIACKNIFPLYNVELNLISEYHTDSAVQIDMIGSHENIYSCLKYLSLAFIIFPFSFYRKLDLNVLSLCSNITLLKKNYLNTYEKKLLSGLIPVQRCTSPKQVLDLFLLIVINHMSKLLPQMLDDWKKFFGPFSGTEDKTEKMVIFTSHLETLTMLLKNPKDSLTDLDSNIAFKCKKMKQYLEKIDSDGIDETFWRKAPKRMSKFNE